MDELGRIELWLAVLATASVVQLGLLLVGGIMAARSLGRLSARVDARIDALEPEVRDVLQRVARLTDEAGGLVADSQAALRQINRVVERTADRVEQADHAIDAVSGAASSLGRSAVGGWVRTLAAVAGAIASPRPAPGPRRPAPPPQAQP